MTNRLESLDQQHIRLSKYSPIKGNKTNKQHLKIISNLFLQKDKTAIAITYIKNAS